MSYALFVAGSIIEYFSYFIFMFALFRFRFRDRMFYLVFVSFIMSQVSYFTRLNPEIGELSSYIQLTLLIIAMWVLFRVPLYYSIVMNGAGFVFGFAVQGLVILFLWQTGTPLGTIQDNALASAATQALSALLVIGFSRLIFIKNWGFDYVPTSHRAYVRISGVNALLLVIIVIAAVAACLTAFLFKNEFKDYIILSNAIFIISVPLFLYYSFRKDHEDAS
ncbi:hypothetical protein ACFOLF_09850 [Paenibacillus sepulcri]|uniref:Uncharacterized protein n=1 Tax=Paenibacillus sepulcri TaxID=359917 RepID=A0ABS7C7E3_9BACL|nr:hypothetical protein [Paenibacillus sepulcri]